MADIDNKLYISKVKLPGSNETYFIKDAEYRKKLDDYIKIGMEIVIAWDGNSTPDATKIPAGVNVTYGSTTYTGTLAASDDTMGKLYFVHSSSQTLKDVYDEYITVRTGTEGSYSYGWEKIGDTQIEVQHGIITPNSIAHTVTNPTISATINTTKIALNSQTDTVLKELATSKLVTTSVTPAESASTTLATGKSTKYLHKTEVTQHTFSDVTVPIKNENASTFVTGLNASGTGSDGDPVTNVTGTVTVPMAASVTNNVVTMSGSVASVVTGISNVTDNNGVVTGVTGTFNTDAIKSATLDIKSSSETGYTSFIESVSGATSDVQFVSGDALASATLQTVTIGGVGVVSEQGDVSLSSDDTETGGISYTMQGITVSYGGSEDETLTFSDASTKYMHVSITNPTKMNLSIGTTAAEKSDVTSTVTTITKYMNVTTEAAGTGSPTVAKHALQTQAIERAAIQGVSGTDTPTLNLSVTKRPFTTGNVIGVGENTTTASMAANATSVQAYTSLDTNSTDGEAVIGDVTLQTITYATAGTGVTVATGALATDGTGATVATGSASSGGTVTVLKSDTAITSDATTGVEVVTGVTNLQATGGIVTHSDTTTKIWTDQTSA